MKNFFDKLSYKIQQLMQGRYGFDELSQKMVIVSLICFIIFIFTRITLLLSFAIVLIVMIYLRCFSKNVYSRKNELNVYYEFTGKIKSKINLMKMIWRDKKTYRYFRCKNCKTVLRVPKGKGKIEITCSKCKSKMVKKS